MFTCSTLNILRWVESVNNDEAMKLRNSLEIFVRVVLKATKLIISKQFNICHNKPSPYFILLKLNQTLLLFLQIILKD